MRHFIILVGFLSQALWAYEVPTWVREKYAPLYQLSVEQLPDGSARFHRGRRFEREGVYVLSLHGDTFEMAFQHGRLLQQQVQGGALPQVASIVENSLKNALPNIPMVASVAAEYFQKNYSDKILAHAINNLGGNEEELLLEAYGLAEGSGFSTDLVLKGVLGPESLQVVLGERMKGKTSFPISGSANSCTDFVVKGSVTASGEMIVGRNTDYPLNGFFDRYPTVIYYHPTDGAQRYLSVTSAGLHNAGVIAYNESGLFIGVHTIPTTEVSTSGHPVFLVGQEVMRSAHNFDEAVAIFEKYKPAAGWTYTLASVKENRMASIELTHQRISVREAKVDWHAQTNHYITQKMKNANLDMNASVTEDTHARFLRTEQMIQEGKGHFGVPEAIKILSDKWDPIRQEVKGLGNVVAVHTTLSSVVVDPAHGRMFVASGTAPVSLTPYVELPLIQEWDAAQFFSDSFQVLENSDYFKTHPHLAQAEQKYIEAKTAFETDNDPKRATQILEESIRLDPQNAAYTFVHGILALKAGDMDSAEKSFLENLQKTYLHYRLASQYYLGRIHASRGKSKRALQAFEAVLKEANPQVEAPLIKATRKALQQVKRLKRVPLMGSTLVIFMPEADMVEY
ncbi:hypothetical protein EBR78_00680 [bacterium]|nr:hypothetical protein [bacterium]